MPLLPESQHRPRNFAAALRGFGPLGLLAVVVVFLGNGLFAPLSAILVLAWARLSETPYSELGFLRPRSWVVLLGVGVVLGALLKLLFKSAVMPAIGAPPVNAQFAHLAGNAAALPAMVGFILVAAGFGEETVYRGYLFERFRKVFGTGSAATVATILGTSVAFAAAHFASQGIFGAVQAFLLGLLLGTAYVWQRSLWFPMVLHASFDLTAVALIYTGTERAVSTAFFGS